jgi:hypothetical protein
VETTESQLAIKMINFFTDYGNQYALGDASQTKALELLAKHEMHLAHQKREVISSAEKVPPRL